MPVSIYLIFTAKYRNFAVQIHELFLRKISKDEIFETMSKKSFPFSATLVLKVIGSKERPKSK
jgi:hypothetical protein